MVVAVPAAVVAIPVEVVVVVLGIVRVASAAGARLQSGIVAAMVRCAILGVYLSIFLPAAVLSESFFKT